MFTQVLGTEFLKLRRSKVTWLSLGPTGIALFMWIVREPHRAAQLGLVGTEANLSGLTATHISGSSGKSAPSRPAICSGEYFFSRSSSTLPRNTTLEYNVAGFGRQARS